MSASMKLGDLNCIPLFLNELVEKQKESSASIYDKHMNWLKDVSKAANTNNGFDELKDLVEM